MTRKKSSNISQAPREAKLLSSVTATGQTARSNNQDPSSQESPFRHAIPSSEYTLTPRQALHIADVYLRNALRENDHDIAMVMCRHADILLNQSKVFQSTSSTSSSDPEDQALREFGATAYSDIGKVLEAHGHQSRARIFYGKCRKLGGTPKGSSGRSTTDTPTSNPPIATSGSQGTRHLDVATVPPWIFKTDIPLPVIPFTPPEPDTRLNDTPQLVFCLDLLRGSHDSDDTLDPSVRNWLLRIKSDSNEKERLKALATDIIKSLRRHELLDPETLAEVAHLAPVLDKEDFRHLLEEYHSEMKQTMSLCPHHIEGLARLIRSAGPGYLEAGDFIKILDLIDTRLTSIHHRSLGVIYAFALAASHVLDVMTDAEIKNAGWDRLREPLSSYLNELKRSSDPYLVFQAAYTYQAILCAPGDVKPWQAATPHTDNATKGVTVLDINDFLGRLSDIQQGEPGLPVSMIPKNAYGGATSLSTSGQSFLNCLRDGYSFDRKCAWYTALRGADTMIRKGHFTSLRRLICEAPCRLHSAFQWGICQRLGEVAANPMWDSETRRDAIEFLGEIYRNDATWGTQPTVKQHILNTLMKLTAISRDEISWIVAEALMLELEGSGDVKKRAFYSRVCQDEGPTSHILGVSLPALGSPSLLDRVQNTMDAERHIRPLRTKRMKKTEKAVYIPLQAQADLQAPDSTRHLLMDTVKDFLVSKKEVLLLLGDPGSGKSAFCRELEYELWQIYKRRIGAIPLHIYLPTIDKPEHDMVTKQLRKAEFTEPQIQELKMTRKFILICDGYDEINQTHNLYTSNRLNQPGGWNAKMVISCRTECLGADYRDRFQPGDNNNQSEPKKLQEAVIAPFSSDQVRSYIRQYVLIRQPVWSSKEYMDVLDHNPSIKEVVKNPFLMSLSLEVLPRMMYPGQDLSVMNITQLGLYEQLVDYWFERAKKCFEEGCLSPQARAAFEDLKDEGFTQSGIEFLKRLSLAIYKEQDGLPIVQYSRHKNERSWKSEFFCPEEESLLLREACPLIKSGNRYRFVHQSLLEYGLALAIFDPQDWKGLTVSKSFVFRVTTKDKSEKIGPKPDLDSPLAWRNFVQDHTVLKFLAERVRQEPAFKQLLLDYIQYSKISKKWSTAATNAITVLVQAGVPFIKAELQYIRVPGADLRNGMFEAVNLQGADLRDVNLRGAWLIAADMKEAQFSGVQLGELPTFNLIEAVSLVAYSTDGKSFAIVSSIDINVYSTSTLALLKTLKGHTGWPTSVEYSPSGRHIASGGFDDTVRLWDVETGSCVHILKGHRQSVTCVTFSPQGSQVASASNDKTVRLWNADTGECIVSLEGHTDSIQRIVFSPKGDQLASWSKDRTVRLWDVQAGFCSYTLSKNSDHAPIIAYSPQGHQFAFSSYGKALRLYDPKTGRLLRALTTHQTNIVSAEYSPKGDTIASTCGDKTVRLWDIETGICLRTLSSDSSGFNSIAYSPRGDLLATVNGDKTTRLWDVETGVCRQSKVCRDIVTSVKFSPGGSRVLSYGRLLVELWDVETEGSRLSSSGHRSYVYGVTFSPLGHQAASCSGDGDIRLWDLKTGVCRWIFTGHTEAVKCIAFAPRSGQLASSSEDMTVRLWDVRTGDCLKILRGHTQGVTSVAYSPNESRIMTSSSDRTMRLWDVPTGVCVLVLKDISRSTDVTYITLQSVTFSPRGDRAVSVFNNHTMHLRNLDTGGGLRQMLVGHSRPIRQVVFSPEGDRFVSASDDQTLRLWDADRGMCKDTLLVMKPVVSMAFSPDGSKIAIACDSTALQIWNTESRWRIPLEDSLHNDNFVVFSSKGDLLASAGPVGVIRLWDTKLGRLRTTIHGHRVVKSIAWKTISDINYLMAGYDNGSVAMWQVDYDEKRCDVHPLWKTTTGTLRMERANLKGAKGLSPHNSHLLRQMNVSLGPSSSKFTFMTLASIVIFFWALYDAYTGKV